MKTTVKIVKYAFSDLARNRWMLLYGLFFLLLAEGLFRFGGNGTKVLLSLINVVLILIPLVSLFFGAMYLYHARDFVELLLAQPIERGSLFLGMYLGLAIPLAGGFVVGLGVPFLLRSGAGEASAVGLMLCVGVALTLIFLALAFLIATHYNDRVQGLGVALLVWLGTAVLYDGLVLVLLSAFANYPLERPVLALMLLNPVDLARVVLLLNFDISALMGYTGAVVQHFFGRGVGLVLGAAALVAWWSAPFYLGGRLFHKKDF